MILNLVKRLDGTVDSIDDDGISETRFAISHGDGWIIQAPEGDCQVLLPALCPLSLLLDALPYNKLRALEVWPS